MPAVRAGALLFVSGHDPEWKGRLRYRGRVGEALDRAAASAALRLATLNALATARDAAGSLARIRRCVAITAFVHAVPGALDPALVEPSLRLIRAVLGAGAGARPAVWLRPAQGLAGGMSVEVELLLALRPAPAVSRRPAPLRG